MGNQAQRTTLRDNERKIKEFSTKTKRMNVIAFLMKTRIQRKFIKTLKLTVTEKYMISGIMFFFVIVLHLQL